MSTTLDPKDPDVSAEYEINFHDALVIEAARRADLALALVVFYPQDPGWYYEVTTAGRTAKHYPKSLPRAAGQTVQDGSATLTCRHPSTATLPGVQSVTWTVPSGITKASQRESGRSAFVTLSGGTDGEDYEILCRMTPTTGNVIEQTITVPVRAQ